MDTPYEHKPEKRRRFLEFLDRKGALTWEERIELHRFRREDLVDEFEDKERERVK